MLNEESQLSLTVKANAVNPAVLLILLLSLVRKTANIQDAIVFLSNRVQVPWIYKAVWIH